MDMMYMPDELRACVELMEADPSKLVHRNSFNIASMSFTPEIICAEVKKLVPGFTMDYNVDPVKESIARSWPNSLDDTCAREEWGWAPEWDPRFDVGRYAGKNQGEKKRRGCCNSFRIFLVPGFGGILYRYRFGISYRDNRAT